MMVAFMNQACHYVDLIEWLNTDTKCSSNDVHDQKNRDGGYGRVKFKWGNGAIGSMAVTMLTYPRNLEGSITILGETGTVRVGGTAVNKILDWEFFDQREYDQRIEDASYETESVYGFGHLKYYGNVADVFRGKAEPTTDGREGLRLMELLTACHIAAKDQTTVNLPIGIFNFSPYSLIQPICFAGTPTMSA